MDALLNNARRIFNVAQAAAQNSSEDEPQDFAVLIQPNGAVHFIMEMPFSLEGVASYMGVASAWKISRSRDGIRVEGRDAVSEICLREPRGARQEFLRGWLGDAPLYRIASPLLSSPLRTSTTVSS